jgi:hypothetical protein
MNARALGAQTTNTANLKLTVTTQLSNFPLFPATLTGLIASVGAPNDSAAAFSNPNCQEMAASGTFVYDWTFSNRYDATAATYTPPSPAPSTAQSLLSFLSLPYQRVVNFYPAFSGSNWASVFVDAAPGTPPPSMADTYPGVPSWPGLVSWSFSSTTLVFEFAAWFWSSDIQYAVGIYGPLASAPATVTQTITLGGTAYTQAEVAADCATLMGAVDWVDIPWYGAVKNTWDTSGNVVATPAADWTSPPAANTESDLTESGQVGTHVPYAVAVNGCPYPGNPVSWPFFQTQALVDICGNYCLRTYAVGTSGPISCANGNIDGYAPITLSPPTTPGQSVAAYNAAQCA